MSDQGTLSGASIDEARSELVRHLLDARDARGAIVGELSTSALSTATATLACALACEANVQGGPSRDELVRLARQGADWLAEHANADGGYGDTVDSPSNISTTTVAWAALSVADRVFSDAWRDATSRVEAHVARAVGGDRIDPVELARVIRARYGKDHTFSVPILTTCAIAGKLGPDGWRLVPQLPFELAACPHQWFQWLNLRTVSYALPALIAIGQARHGHRPTRLLPLRWLRSALAGRTRRIARRIQPSSGGYLEAAPLTSFVAMSLISIGHGEDPVVLHGLRFLASTVRHDGSWPIDTNLDTWTTTLAVHALGDELAPTEGAATRRWLLDQQYRTVHPFTHADPGGFAWTDLPGGVPDADDTPAALIALSMLSSDDDQEAADAAARGITWLLDLQNRDGGIPTFCRGWGKLQFDQSSPDLTAHTMRAFMVWRDRLDAERVARIDRAIPRAVRFLLRSQRADGAWIPLWFGNQSTAEQENPLYGTSRVLLAIAETSSLIERLDPALANEWCAAGERAARYLMALAEVRQDGAIPVGATPSIEETAQAVEALAAFASAGGGPSDVASVARRGAEWVVAATAGGRELPAAPIGLYFAKLWYSERLYPVVFAAGALAAVRRLERGES